MDVLVIDNICRICLQRQDTLFSLFRKIKGSSPFEKLVNKALLKIEINDAGPSSICSQCLIELDTTVNFLNKCEQSNQILTSRVQTTDSSNQDNLKTGVEGGICDIKGDDESLCLERSGSKCRLIGYTRVNTYDVSEKAVESVEDELEEPVVTQTPAEVEAARCPDCGSLRRCRHWAPPTTYSCQYCQKVFNRKFNLKLHIKRHLGERDWPCPTCGVRLLTQGLAKRHCEPRKRRVCPVAGCGKSFTTNTNLTTHIRVHSGERPHVCTECGKTFTSKNTLNSHIRIHTGAKPYICPVCGRQFRTNKVSAHMAVHGVRARHVCAAAACARSFASRRALRLHARTHAPRARLACALCPAVYAHSQSLRKHTRRRHQEPQPLV